MIWESFSSRRFVQARSAARQHARQNCEEGFALVDVLVGLTIIGVLSALMVSFLSQAKTIGRFGSDAQMQIELEAVADYLENAIAAAEPIPLAGGTADRRDYVRGDGSSLRISTIRAIGFQEAALQEVIFSMSPTAGGEKNLIISTRPRFGFAGTAAPSEPVVLQAGVVTFQFEYLHMEAAKPAWTNSWDQPGKLPSAIRFRFSVRRVDKIYEAKGVAILALAKDATASQ